MSSESSHPELRPSARLEGSQSSADFQRIIAIDGPAASGKSSVARELAKRLGFVYVNSGAMYRAVTWHALEKGIDPADLDRVAALVEALDIRRQLTNNEARVAIDNVDPSTHLRDERVNKEVSRVSSFQPVRRFVDQQLHQCARENDVVVEGRDIGSVVFPNTPYKFYIDASPDVRLRRRAAEGLTDEIAARDRADSSRPAAPLVIAKDAEVIDSSQMTINEVVDEITKRLQAQGLEVELHA